MRRELIEVLACPLDGGFPLDLEDERHNGEEIVAGGIVCPACASRFHIVDGIPVFLKLGDDDIGKIQLNEITARDLARRHSTHKPGDRLEELERYPELDALRQAVGDCRDLRVLDAGCGLGMMTQVLRPAARVVCLDFSLIGLSKFDRSGFRSLDLILGDVCRMPFRNERFDLAISSQVLEHVPTAQLRAGFINQLAQSLKPGGKLILTVYNWDRNRSATGVPKEGFHPNKIFYHCYTADELRDEMQSNFDVEAIWGVQVLLPKTYRFVKALRRNYQYWDRIWRRKAIALRYSNLLLTICRRRAEGDRTAWTN